MARSDLDPILRETDGNDDDEERSSTPNWSWICFHCHSSRSVVTPSVVCICRTLKSALYRRAFHYSTRLGGGTCNLEYEKQVAAAAAADRPTRRRGLSQTDDPPLDDDGGSGTERCFRQTPVLPPRRFTYYGCSPTTGDASASSHPCSPSSSFSHSLGNMTSSSDVGDTHQLMGGQLHLPGSTSCIECDNKSFSPGGDDDDDGHRPICINWLANIGSPHSSSSCGFCRRKNQKPNSVTRIPEVQRKQQQQQRVRHRSQDNDDCNNKTTTSSTYTRCKLQHRSYDDLKTLLENFRMQVQAVSEDLVRLLEERHDLKQQIDMRNIAIEQLMRLKNDEEPTTRQNQVDAGTVKAGTIQGRGGQVEERTITGRDEKGIVRRTSETKECFFTTTTLRTIRTIE